MKKKTLMFVALGAGAYFLWKKQRERAAVAAAQAALSAPAAAGDYFAIGEYVAI